MNYQFPIKVLKKNQGLIDLSFLLVIIGSLGVLLFYISMAPSKNSSLELQTFWFIKGVPLWVKKVLLYGLLIFTTGIMIGYLNRRAKRGLMYISGDGIVIEFKKNPEYFSFGHLKEIEIVTGLRYFWNGASKMTLVLKTRKDNIIRLKILFEITVEEMAKYLEPAALKDVEVTIDTDDPYSYRSK